MASILLVEDNEADIVLTRLAFEEADLNYDFAVAHNGEEALDYLHRRPPFVEVPVPALILLDLNMPRMNGKQFLEAVKFDPQLRNIPVILLTSSQAQGDINECYHLRAHSYLVKPSTTSERFALAKRVNEFLNNIAVAAKRAQ